MTIERAFGIDRYLYDHSGRDLYLFRLESLASGKVSATTGVARINGAELYHETSGEGYPLVLLHDGLLDSRVWDKLFEIFSESYETIRYDRRGYGRSRSPSSEFSLVEETDMSRLEPLISSSMSGSIFREVLSFS